MSIIKQEGLSLNLTNGKVYCDSRELAKQFGKAHKNVIRNIEVEIERFRGSKVSHQNLVNEYFKEDFYIDSRGKKYPRYLLTFKGFQQIALQFSGKEAFDNRVRFIEFFEKLLKNIELDKLQAITNSKDELWLQFRAEGKVFRNRLTKVIHDTVEVYRNNIEKKMNDGKYYFHYTAMIYNKLGIELPKGTNPRDVLDKRMLVRLEDLEDRVADLIEQYTEDGLYYKEIFKKIKELI